MTFMFYYGIISDDLCCLKDIAIDKINFFIMSLLIYGNFKQEDVDYEI